MSDHGTLVTQFYRAFQQRDYATMQECYADTATFSDPVFRELNAEQVRAMWKMFCIRDSDLRISFRDVAVDGDNASAHWTATYTFSASGRKVVNEINALFTFNEGKIIRHVDRFDLYRWTSQALGWKGILLGWTPMVRNKVRLMAIRGLKKFMES
jgi:ketosteroid isomerase-like protein